MCKYITELNQVGESTLNVDLVCKDWDDNKFSILTWEERYTFILNRKGKCKDILCKSLISKEQALEVVNRLNLIHVKDLTFRSAGAYRTISFIKSESERIAKIKKEKEEELSIISRMQTHYETIYCANRYKLK